MGIEIDTMKMIKLHNTYNISFNYVQTLNVEIKCVYSFDITKTECKNIILISKLFGEFVGL